MPYFRGLPAFVRFAVEVGPVRLCVSRVDTEDGAGVGRAQPVCPSP